MDTRFNFPCACLLDDCVSRQLAKKVFRAHAMIICFASTCCEVRETDEGANDAEVDGDAEARPICLVVHYRQMIMAWTQVAWGHG